MAPRVRLAVALLTTVVIICLNVRWNLRPIALPRPAKTHAFAFVTFTDGRTLGEGLHVLGSTDGRRWTALAGDPLVLKQGALGVVFRDPSIAWHGGYFHLAFTTELCVGLERPGFDCHWEQRSAHAPPARFGYARSVDLVTWENVRPVAVELPNACNVWAPDWVLLDAAETAALGGGPLAVVFSSVVASPCPPNFGPGVGAAISRPYITTMHGLDAARWTAPRLLFDFGESSIDAHIMRSNDGGVHAVWKSEQNVCREFRWRADASRPPLWVNRSCTLALRLARAPSILGPWEAAPLGATPLWADAISPMCSEGPTPLQLDGGRTTLLYYDAYRTDCILEMPSEMGRPCAKVPGLSGAPAAASHRGSCAYRNSGGLRALVSDDLRSWREAGAEVRIPPAAGGGAHKHGTAVALPREALCAICASARRELWAPTGVLGRCALCQT